MGANSVAAKVARGLAKAYMAVGENDSPTLSLARYTTTGGGNNPFDPPTQTKESIELENAIFKSIDKSSIDNDLIKQGDMELVCDGSVEINQGDVIESTDGKEYIVVSVDISSPYGIPLAYTLIVRLK